MQTLEEIEASGKTTLTPLDIAPILKCDPHSIRVQAHNDARKLGFPVIVIGNRTKIPKDAFLFYQKYGAPIIPKSKHFESSTSEISG